MRLQVHAFAVGQLVLPGFWFECRHAFGGQFVAGHVGIMPQFVV